MHIFLMLFVITQSLLYASVESEKGVISWLLYPVGQEYYDAQLPIAQVSPSTPLSVSEIEYAKKRLSYGVDSLSKKFEANITVDTMPRIALCLSGGGLRSMVGSLGFLQALDEAGLLDCINYISSLSGSTWAISGWLESGMSVAEYINFLKGRLSIGLLNSIDCSALRHELFKKLSYDQELCLSDVWGNCIAQKILANPRKKNLSKITLADYIIMPDNGSVPLPIYSSVMVLPPETTVDRYEWMEWTPWHIRCPYLKTTISVEGLGRTFKEGISNNYVPVSSLSCALGVWGSAMSLDSQDVLSQKVQTSSGYGQAFLKALLSFVQTHEFIDAVTSVRMFPSEVPHWNYGLSDKPMNNQKTLTMVDAGLLCNLPIISLLDPQREVDIIIVVDLSYQPDTGQELICTQAYAHKQNLPFPAINRAYLNQICSVHTSADKRVPTIIYFPMISNHDYKDNWNPYNDDFTSTFNLTYTPEQIDRMSGLMYTACKQNIKQIQQIIGEKINARHE